MQHKTQFNFAGLCLVYAESGGDTSKISHGPGLSKYGLFQLEGTEWCGLGYQGGKCQMDCRGKLYMI